jgi:hypothetical protein
LEGSLFNFFDVTGLKSGDLLKCDFVLQESGQVLNSQVEVRRVAYWICPILAIIVAWGFNT